jgi:hypothetical protein
VEVRGAREGAGARRGEALFLTETRRHGGGQGSDFSFQGSGEALCAEDGGLMAEEEEKAERGTDGDIGVPEWMERCGRDAHAP